MATPPKNQGRQTNLGFAEVSFNSKAKEGKGEEEGDPTGCPAHACIVFLKPTRGGGGGEGRPGLS